MTAVTLALLVATMPSVAAQTIYVTVPTPAISKVSIERAVVRSMPNPSVIPPVRARQGDARMQETSGDPAGEPRQFFGSAKGLAVLAVLGTGVGYAVYSKVHDRIHSKNPDR